MSTQQDVGVTHRREFDACKHPRPKHIYYEYFRWKTCILFRFASFWGVLCIVVTLNARHKFKTLMMLTVDKINIYTRYNVVCCFFDRYHHNKNINIMLVCECVCVRSNTTYSRNTVTTILDVSLCKANKLYLVNV